MTKDYLLSIREVQQVTAPNYCLGASKFLALKLLGFVQPHAHLNDFLKSRWAMRNWNLPLAACWGGSMADHNGMFNSTVLPAAVNDATAGVMTARGGHVRFHTGFTYFYGNPGKADTMLNQMTPLVVGVSIHGGSSRDHFIVIFKDVEGHTWAVDPWPGHRKDSIQELAEDFSFVDGASVHMTADEKVTQIPCGHPFFGYFC